MMFFKRKAYGELLNWKNEYADRYAVMLEGARRVGKSTIAEQFARDHYKSYILIDFSNTSNEIKECFDDIHDLDFFFLRLQTLTRIYMAVGGMPQAVGAYVEGNNFSVIDRIKRQIIDLYEEDFKKIDPSGRLSAMYHSIPAQLSKDTKRYRISLATGKRRTMQDENLIYDLIDSKTVLPCYNSADPFSSTILVTVPQPAL